VETRELTKEYRVGFWKRQRRLALDRLSLQVERAEIFGLLGPNGAGKSTTLKLLLHLINPTSGTACLLGRPSRDFAVRSRLGFLPENPYFYDYLTGEEFLNYAAGLFGIERPERRQRVSRLIERVGLDHAQGIPLRKFSKGMVQRLGIAQALINDPELVILDEPMSGLDPVGRREVRDLIEQLRAEGKTVLFSTHILSDAEALCDRVAILNHGKLQGAGNLRRILSLGVKSTEVILENASPGLLAELKPLMHSPAETADRIRFELPLDDDSNEDHALISVLDSVIRHGGHIVSVNPVRMSLEDYFLSRVEGNQHLAEPLNSGMDRDTALPLKMGHPQPEIKARGWQVWTPGEPNRTPHDGSPSSSALGSTSGLEQPGAATATAQAASGTWLGRVVTIAHHTFKEAVRDNVLYGLVVFAVLLIGAAILFGTISVGAEQIILVNLSLSSISMIGLLMAIFIGIGLVSKEIERRSINNILSKPVRRSEFIAGKYLGLLLTLALNTAVMTAVFYIALYYEKRGFARGDAAALEAVYFILLELALVVAIALLFSCISSPVLSAVYTFALFVIGNFSGDLRAFGESSASALVHHTTTVLYYLLPNFTDFSMITQAAHGQLAPPYQLAANSLYTLLYATVLVSAAVMVFEEREFQ
jgi:ABC-2 type transport system ATP-binding protein